MRLRSTAIQTPPDRDRYADFLRVLSIGLVVLGHWLAAVVLVRDGELVIGRLHALVPWTRWLTWVFQVMPVFFIVGGFVNARSWSRAARGEHSWSGWTRRRCQRLLVPLFPLVAFWVLLTPVLLAAGLPREAVRLASQGAFAPIWFLGVYLLVIALVPMTWALHRRFAWKAVMAFIVAAAGVDVLVRAGMPGAGAANMLVVWAGVHQIGYFWHDERLSERGIVGIGLMLIGTATLLALVTLGGYPVSMVAADAEVRSNVSPPSVALFVLALIQVGIVIAARRVLSGWLERPRVWAVVVILGSTTLTVYLWHMTAIILVAALAYLSGVWPYTSAIDTAWWASRVPWLMLCGALLALLVFLFSRFERAVVVLRPAPVRTLVGLTATLAGIAFLAQRGLYAPDVPWSLSLAVIAVLAGGLASLGALRLIPPPHSTS
jgi:peptidoglycan/LPS O-acetylase OafA/YrhL